MARTVLAVECDVNVITVRSVTAWTARVHAHLGGKVVRVTELVTPATTDLTASTGEQCL